MKQKCDHFSMKFSLVYLFVEKLIKYKYNTSKETIYIVFMLIVCYFYFKPLYRQS